MVLNPKASPGPNKRNRPKGRGIKPRSRYAAGLVQLTILNSLPLVTFQYRVSLIKIHVNCKQILGRTQVNKLFLCFLHSNLKMPY